MGKASPGSPKHAFARLGSRSFRGNLCRPATLAKVKGPRLQRRMLRCDASRILMCPRRAPSAKAASQWRAPASPKRAIPKWRNVMTKALRTMSAATVALGLAAAAPTAAQAFVIVPAVAAAWLAGGVLGGAVLGTAVTNSATYPAPGVTVNSTTCYFTNRLVNPVTQQWTREQVCTTPAP